MTNLEIIKEDTSSIFLKSELLRHGILDEEGILHYEFVSGAHGRKLDFDKIQTGSTLYNLWVGVMAHKVKEIYQDDIPPVIVGVANGANRLALSMAPILGDGIQAIQTEKVSAKEVTLTDIGRFVIQKTEPDRVLIVEDVGTTGSTTVTAVESLYAEGVIDVEALVTWQRQPNLQRLDDIGIFYEAVIFDPLPTFSPEDCANSPEGYCSRDIKLIPHEQ